MSFIQEHAEDTTIEEISSKLGKSIRTIAKYSLKFQFNEQGIPITHKFIKQKLPKLGLHFIKKSSPQSLFVKALSKDSVPKQIWNFNEFCEFCENKNIKNINIEFYE